MGSLDIKMVYFGPTIQISNMDWKHQSIGKSTQLKSSAITYCFSAWWPHLESRGFPSVAFTHFQFQTGA